MCVLGSTLGVVPEVLSTLLIETKSFGGLEHLSIVFSDHKLLGIQDPLSPQSCAYCLAWAPGLNAGQWFHCLLSNVLYMDKMEN